MQTAKQTGPFHRQWIFFSNGEWQNPIKALTQCSHRNQSVCLFKQMVHLPLHLSAIRCNYLSQQGQLQRVKSIPQCRSSWDCFQHIIFVLVVCSYLIRTVCTSSCFTVCFAYSGCHHMASVHIILLFFALHWQHCIHILVHTKVCLKLSNIGFCKKFSSLIQ